jgi:hypothetical protein
MLIHTNTYTHTYTYTYTYTCSYIHTHTHTHIHTHAHTYTHIHTHIYINTYTHIYIHMLIHTHTYTHTYTYTHTHTYTYTCSYIHTHTHTHIHILSLGTFAKLRKTNLIFVIFFRPSARYNNSAHTVRILMKFNIWVFWNNCIENSVFITIGQECLVLYMQTNTHCWSYLAQLILELEIFQTKFVEEIKTHILCSATLFFSKIVPFIRWKNMIERGRPQMTIWQMCIA